MTILQSFIFFLLSLQIRDGCTVEAATLYGASGENISFMCLFHSFGTLKILCRETCEGENLLIRTSDDTAQSGRYTIKYIREASRTYSVLSVSISELTQSNSGLYRCGLGDSSSSASYQDFRLVVAEAVLDGNKDHHFYKEPGSSLTVICSFGSSGRTKSFCRGGCREEEVLVQTDGDRAQRGRYSIEYDAGPASGAVLLVTVTHLTQSDSGRYRCRMDKTLLADLFRDFSITVTEVDPSISTPPTTQSLCSSLASVFSKTTDVTLENTTTSKGSSFQTSANVLWMALILTFTMVLFSVAVLIYCNKTLDKPQTGIFIQPEQAPATELRLSRMHEDDRGGDEEWRYVDVDIYLTYCETSNTDTFQHKAEDESSKSNYTEMDVSSDSCHAVEDLL
ncbi:polymeric immunoglobulin receptor-like isoform X2 [Girardinichthys multiradiatus]|uniref:polymeric immunoglobulin receptor-like isoform X2 n=1 Tax=Girardinichthys multiradiatus TaxID=208333 RepID=UPI001FAD07BE|nr:polymeric immunoglobulin receptor-like isoform X2 [Girardinichthys multiradiatus]